jgi:hypothetical protein
MQKPLLGEVTFRGRHRSIDDALDLVVEMETPMHFPCVNYEIPLRANQSADRIEIHLAPITEPSFCFTAFGPATASFAAQPLPPGQYDLMLYGGACRDHYRIIVSAEEFEIQAIETELSSLFSVDKSS